MLHVHIFRNHSSWRTSTAPIHNLTSAAAHMYTHCADTVEKAHFLARRLLEHRAQLVRDLLVLLPVLCRVDGVAGLFASKMLAHRLCPYVVECSAMYVSVSHLLASELLGLIKRLVEVIFTAAVGHFCKCVWFVWWWKW